MSNWSQQISYLRIAGTAVGWCLIAKHPFEFGAVWAACDLLSWLSLLCCGVSKSPLTDYLLTYVADIMWASIMMFSRVQIAALTPI